MSDWTDELDPEARKQWDEFVASARKEAVVKIAGSHIFLTLVPPEKSWTDVKFAVELGLSIMMDKPIIAIVMPGREIPEKLRRVADYICEADIDTAAGQAKLQGVLAEAYLDLGKENSP